MLSLVAPQQDAISEEVQEDALSSQDDPGESYDQSPKELLSGEDQQSMGTPTRLGLINLKSEALPHSFNCLNHESLFRKRMTIGTKKEENGRRRGM